MATTIGEMLLLLVIVIATAPWCKAGCTSERLNHCISSHLTRASHIMTSSILPSLTEVELDQSCSNYYDFEACVQTFKGLCEDGFLKKRLLGIESAYDYICTEAKQVYLRNSMCLDSSLLLHEGYICEKHFEGNMARLSGNISAIRDQLCLFVENYLDCIENAIFSFCGQEAADFQREFDRRALQHTLEHYECKGWDSTSEDCGGKGHSMRSDVLVKVIPVTSVVCVIVVIIVIIVVIKRKKARDEVRRQLQHVPQDAPPPYSLSPLALNTVDNQLARANPVEPPAHAAPLAMNIYTPPEYDPRKEDYDPRKEDYDPKKESGKHTEQPPPYSTYNRLPQYASGANNQTPISDNAIKY